MRSSLIERVHFMTKEYITQVHIFVHGVAQIGPPRSLGVNPLRLAKPDIVWVSNNRNCICNNEENVGVISVTFLLIILKDKWPFKTKFYGFQEYDIEHIYPPLQVNPLLYIVDKWENIVNACSYVHLIVHTNSKHPYYHRWQLRRCRLFRSLHGE